MYVRLLFSFALSSPDFFLLLARTRNLSAQSVSGARVLPRGLAGAKQPAAEGSAGGGTVILAAAAAAAAAATAGAATTSYDIDGGRANGGRSGDSLTPLMVPSDWGGDAPPLATADLPTAPPSSSPEDEAAGIGTAGGGAAGATGVTATAPRPPRNSTHGRILRSRHPGSGSTGEDEERLDMDRAAARRALLNPSSRRMSGGSDGGCSSGSSGSGAGGGSRTGGGAGGARSSGRSAARRGGDEEGGGPGAPPSQSSELGSREGGGGAFFSFSPGVRIGSPAGEGEGGAGAGAGKTFSKRPENMLSPLRSPMLRQEGGESTGSGKPAAASSDPPAAAAVPTEEAFDPAYGRRWAALMGLAPSSVLGGASAGSNGVPASSNGVPASSNGVPRATNGVGAHEDGGSGASARATNAHSSDNGVGPTARTRASSDSDGGIRAASPLGQMVMVRNIVVLFFCGKQCGGYACRRPLFFVLFRFVSAAAEASAAYVRALIFYPCAK